MTKVDLYLKFRAELDKIWVPVWVGLMDCVELICCDDKLVGMVCGDLGYIDVVYVLPEYRRKGLAKTAVLEWWKRYKSADQNTHLHIINNNEVALRFWNSLFVLREVEKSETDTLYEILMAKDGD